MKNLAVRAKKHYNVPSVAHWIIVSGRTAAGIICRYYARRFENKAGNRRGTI